MVTSRNALAYVPGTAPIWPYSSECGAPRAALPEAARTALATAVSPAHCGVDRLVPPILIQLTEVLPDGAMATYWPVPGSALKATSGTARRAKAPIPGTALVW